MQQLEQTEPIADICGPIIGTVIALLTLGCGGCGLRTAVSDSDDAQGTPDLPASPTDLPVEPTEYEGIVVGINYHAEPSRFYACDTGELWEMRYDHSDPDSRIEGSCDGVFKRVRGQLDRSVDPPVLIIEETLEARWTEPGDCVVNWMPIYDSCYQENERFPCDPLVHDSGCHEITRCNPVRFRATQEAGWMEARCLERLGNAQTGEPCEYPKEPWEVDTCAHGLRCWNAAGDVKQPGVCVPYCDPTGEVGPTCEGTCVQCSGDDRGLCMQGCTGDGCNVDAFC